MYVVVIYTTNYTQIVSQTEPKNEHKTFSYSMQSFILSILNVYNYNNSMITDTEDHLLFIVYLIYRNT